MNWRILLLLNCVQVSQIYVAPGNGGTDGLHKASNIPIATDDFAGLVGFAKKNYINLVVPGR